MIRIGVDLVSKTRINKILEQYYFRFIKKIITTKEENLCNSNDNMLSYISNIFAAKEAVAKAIGTGIGSKIAWHDIEIFSDSNMRPYVVISERAKKYIENVLGPNMHIDLTVSNEDVFSIAVVVIYMNIR